MDGNTRLCTATAAAALKASFGTDGQPGSYTDVDHCDALALWGHNIAETQTVLWMRMLDRLHGPDPPAAAVRRSARRRRSRARPTCIWHLRRGTNVALLNGLLRELIHHGWIDEGYVARTRSGSRSCERTVEPYTPARVARDLRRAGRAT